MRVAFCGVGALGSSAAVLCRNLELEGRLLVDFDKVESKNLLAQAYVKQSLGKNKAEALKLQLLNFWGVRADAAAVRIVAENAEAVLGGCDLVIDAFDNQKGRLVLSELARRTGKALVHAAVSADGTFGLVRWDERFAPDAEDAPGQATCEGGEHLPLLGVLSATLARAVQDYVKNGEKWDAMVSLYGVHVMK